MIKTQIENSASKIRAKWLIDWGVTLETSKVIEVINELIRKHSDDIKDPDDVARSFLIGFMQELNLDIRVLGKDEVAKFIKEGWQIRQERKAKRLKTGKITRRDFRLGFPNGDEIFWWLMEKKIIEKKTHHLGFFKGVNDDQKALIISTFPNNEARILAILNTSLGHKKQSKFEYTFNKLGAIQW